MRRPQLAPDWGRVIDDMVRAKLTLAEIGHAMAVDLTDRMISHYRAGVQPTYWRGAALLKLWTEKTGKTLDTVPMREVVRGHRVPNNRPDPPGPRAQSLPDWPPCPPKSVAPLKTKAKRTKKALAA